MSVIRRLGRVVLDGLREAGREATHPGRPPSYHATRSKFWKEPADKAEQTQEAARRMADRDGPPAARKAPAKAPAKAPPPKVAPAKAAPVKAAAAKPATADAAGNLREEEEELPWYLEGQEDVDGWDNTNGRAPEDG